MIKRSNDDITFRLHGLLAAKWTYSVLHQTFRLSVETELDPS
jgi:hypothetical protein